MRISRKYLFFIALLMAAIFAAIGLIPRLRAERNNRTVAFVVENKDLVSLSYQTGTDPLKIWRDLEAQGVQGISVFEYTGEELMYLNSMPLRFGAAGALGVDKAVATQDAAVVIIDTASPYTRLIAEYLSIKLPNIRELELDGETVFVLPGTVDYFRQSAFMPDFQWLVTCSDSDINVLFRPGSCPASDGVRVAESLEWLARKYPQIKCVIPAGVIMAGYPTLAPVARVLREHNIFFAHVEFVRQIGTDSMARLMAPNVLPLHSLTRDEAISRRMSRLQIIERFTRAVHERSIRLLIMRPYDLQMGDRLDDFIADLAATRAALEWRGYNFGWPDSLPQWPAPLAGAFACSIAFIFCAWFYAARLLGIEDGKTAALEIAGLILLSLIVAGLMWKTPLLARVCGGLGAAFVATEAALMSMAYYKKPWAGLILGLLIVVAGGLSVASFYGTTMAALRLTPFSGVKLTLLLPLLLIPLHDFKRKIHPESIGEIVNRPAVWGELAAIGFMMLALLVITLRSDNVSNVPAFEVAFRDFMERVLLIRPRTKEFLVGYPALLIYYYVMKKGLVICYREVFRVAASLAFASAVNTFCHFHTMLLISLARVFNGWWMGILVGLIAVALLNFIGIPLWKKGLREVFH